MRPKAIEIEKSLHHDTESQFKHENYTRCFWKFTEDPRLPWNDASYNERQQAQPVVGTRRFLKESPVKFWRWRVRTSHHCSFRSRKD